jgi:hypothetical protein
MTFGREQLETADGIITGTTGFKGLAMSAVFPQFDTCSGAAAKDVSD